MESALSRIQPLSQLYDVNPNQLYDVSAVTSIQLQELKSAAGWNQP